VLTNSAGNIYLNTFGDGVGCKNASTRNTCGDYCAWLTARNGASIQNPSNPLIFQDLNIRQDLCNGIPQMGPFCPILWEEGEKDSSGLGMTNAIEVNRTHGILLTRPTFHDCLESPGAGLAVVEIKRGKPVCSRPWGSMSRLSALNSVLLTDKQYILGVQMSHIGDN